MQVKCTYFQVVSSTIKRFFSETTLFQVVSSAAGDEPGPADFLCFGRTSRLTFPVNYEVCVSGNRIFDVFGASIAVRRHLSVARNDRERFSRQMTRE